MRKSESIKKTVCLDVDGVLAFYEQFDGPQFGPPNEEGLKLARMLKADGITIIIQTCRTHPLWGPVGFQDIYMKLVEWLALWEVPYDFIDVSGKAIAHAYVDDRAVYFPRNKGPAEEVLKKIQRRMHALPGDKPRGVEQ